MYLKADETYTFGPFNIANSVKVNDIRVKGTSGEFVFWLGIPA